ncbi:MAG: methionine--tRNA ligase [Vicinamibacteria bacterium]|nr:methionine--tRNA ligase [Vicinamibacteria bacterium]
MSRQKIFYHTTPIYYVNDVPHVGHAYTTIAADAITRARRLRGHTAFFLTGTDEHGQNIERTAREKGVPPQEYCDGITARFKSLWARLGVEYDDFIRTTDQRHAHGVERFWELLARARTPDGRDAVYRDHYTGWYCPRCEGFKDDGELTQPGNLCIVHELPCEWTEEENYFFRLSAYEDWIRREIENDRIRIEPAGRRNEVLSVIRQGLKDFSVSRARVKWGIKVPGDPEHVLYVWVDALSNYITALGFADRGERYRSFWEGASERLHLMGKEIIRFHCLYWPAMLKAAGLPAPTRIFAHGWLTRGGKKLSKTTGNVIDADQLITAYGADAVRYFFLREGSFGQDWDYTDDAFVGRFDADLANDLGNLVSRALTMAIRYCDGRSPARPVPMPKTSGIEEELQNDASRAALVAEIYGRYEALDFSGALIRIWNLIGRLNQRIVARAPWEMAKDPARREELHDFLYRLIEGIRVVTVLFSPVMPNAACKIMGMLGVTEETARSLDWGLVDPGVSFGPVEPLFPRIRSKKHDSAQKATRNVESKGEKGGGEKMPDDQKSNTVATDSVDDRIDIAEFARIDLRVARIIRAERISGANRLLKLEVDLGNETRQIVAGIAEAYEPEQLAGRKIALVANLKPARLRGIESNGMLLAASVDGRPVLCTFDADVPVGMPIK